MPFLPSSSPHLDQDGSASVSVSCPCRVAAAAFPHGSLLSLLFFLSFRSCSFKEGALVSLLEPRPSMRTGMSLTLCLATVASYPILGVMLFSRAWSSSSARLHAGYPCPRVLPPFFISTPRKRRIRVRVCVLPLSRRSSSFPDGFLLSFLSFFLSGAANSSRAPSSCCLISSPRWRHVRFKFLIMWSLIPVSPLAPPLLLLSCMLIILA